MCCMEKQGTCAGAHLRRGSMDMPAAAAPQRGRRLCAAAAATGARLPKTQLSEYLCTFLLVF